MKVIGIHIAAKNLVHCKYCGDAMDATAGGVYHRGTAWFKQQKRARSGTNSACLVSWADEWSCQFCIHKLLSDVSVDQMELFQLPYQDE